MCPNMSWRVSACAPLVVALFAPVPAFAQWTAGTDGSQCYCVRPVTQTYYRNVPVTEYQQVKQTVKRPVYETQWVDRQYTEYEPVTESRTAEVPTVSYHPVTEYQPVTRDCGQWITQYHERHMVSPCEYDTRPGIAGWWNRTTYSVRSAFTPKRYATRHYIPNQVTTMVPVTRQVAQHSTQQVTYNVTRMVPRTVTKKVAVNSVRYIDEEVTAMRPVTVMRSIPIGTRTAYVPMTGGGTQTALGPSPDPISGDPQRTVDRRNAEPEAVGPKKPARSNTDSFNNFDSSLREPATVKPSTFGNPQAVPRTPEAPQELSEGQRRAAQEWQVVTVPSAVRVHRWTAHRRAMSAGSSLDTSAVSFADR